MQKITHSHFTFLLNLLTKLNDEQKQDLHQLLLLDTDTQKLILKYIKKYSNVKSNVKSHSKTKTTKKSVATKVVLISPKRQALMDISAETDNSPVYKMAENNKALLKNKPIVCVSASDLNTKEITYLNRELNIHTVNQSAINMRRY